MDDDDLYISKMLKWFSKVNCTQAETTTDNLYSGAVLADFLSTFDIEFFNEKWHDDIVLADRDIPSIRTRCIQAIYSKLCEYYIKKLSRYLEGCSKWSINSEELAVELNRRELAKLLIIVVFVAGTKPIFADKLQLVFDDVALEKLCERLAVFNQDVPPVCEGDKKVIFSLIEDNKKQKEVFCKREEKISKQLAELTSEKDLMDDELAQSRRDFIMLKDKYDSMTAVVEQHNVARQQYEESYSTHYNAEKKIYLLEAELKELRFKNKEMDKELRETSSRLSLIQDEATDVVAANKQLQDELSKLRKQQQKSTEAKSESKEEELLKMRLENYIGEVAKLRSQVTEIEALKAHATNLQMINDDFENRLSVMTERCHESIAENSALRRRVEDLETSMKFANVSLKVGSSEHDGENPSLQDELNGNTRGLSFYEEKLVELEKENAVLKAKADNVARQHHNLLSIKEDAEEHKKTSAEVLQAKLTSYIVMYDDAEAKLKKAEEEVKFVTGRLNEQQIEIERFKGEIAQNTKLMKEKEQALEDYVELHIQTNEALGSTSICDEAKLKLDFVEMKVKLDRLSHELKNVIIHRDALIQEQRLISSHWYHTMLERHGDTSSRDIPGHKVFPEENNLPRPPSASTSSSSTDGSFFRQASKRFPRFFKQ